ncbi:MAG: tRNA (adenosine(37)-N6)-threonylcarbamoyltransferase complex ATPase subunit type 1 TsaE [Clostridia bacterium]|jgi:tRNA threonylcarbamoyladenosine biosynthesis protein TsaE
MDRKTYVMVTENEERTIRLGKIMAAVFMNCVISVTGDLGAGKTHLAKGIALGMGITRHITSPTFNILNIYEKDGIVFNHMDAYRLTGPDMAYDTGIEDILEPNGITLIEWAEKIADVLPDDRVNIYIEKTDDEDKRMMFITAESTKIERMAELIHDNTDR